MPLAIRSSSSQSRTCMVGAPGVVWLALHYGGIKGGLWAFLWGMGGGEPGAWLQVFLRS